MTLSMALGGPRSKKEYVFGLESTAMITGLHWNVEINGKIVFETSNSVGVLWSSSS